MKTASEQIRELAAMYAAPPTGMISSVDIVRELHAILDHLEREPSGGLRDAAQEACDYYFQEHGHYEYVMGQHDENMRAIREALSAAPHDESKEG